MIHCRAYSLAGWCRWFYKLSAPLKSGLLLFVLVLFPMGFASSALSQTSMRDTRRRPPLRHRRARALRKMETPRLIRGVLDAQAAAWNRGDIEGYMNGYDRSPKTEF